MAKFVTLEAQLKFFFASFDEFWQIENLSRSRNSFKYVLSLLIHWLSNNASSIWKIFLCNFVSPLLLAQDLIIIFIYL